MSPGCTLLELLREECGIVSAKNGCAPEGTCGCCLVLIDGRPALSCLRKPEQLEGHEVTTLEGIPEEMRRVLGEAFVLEGGVQCGFCIPGHRCAGKFAAGERPGLEPRVDRKGARRPSLPLHRVRADHRCHTNGGEAWNDHHEMPRTRTAAPFLFRRGVWAETKSGNYA